MKNTNISRIIRLVSQIDSIINKQINNILHSPQFQQLECAWRSLFFLLKGLPQQKCIKIKVLDVNFRDLQKDLLTVIDFEHSQLFKKIYSQEFDLPGGDPFGLLIGNYQFGPALKDIETLQTLMRISALAFAPFIANAAPSMFGVPHYSELKSTLNYDYLFQSNEYHRWKQLQRSEDARFIALTLPRFLIRLPHNQNGAKIENRFFSEQIKNHDHYLWASAAFAYALVICRSFHKTGWLADIRGLSIDRQSGGAIEDLPRSYFSVNNGTDIPKIATDIYLTDRQEKIFSDLGFIPLRDNPYITTAVFYTSSSIQKPCQYSKNIAAHNIHLSSLLQYVLCISRFAHYIKVIIREKIGKFINAEECESYLQKWLLKYCASSNITSSEIKSKYPLNEAKVKITANANEPGKYSCIMQLKPHYQVDEIQSSLHFVTKISL